MLEPEPELGAIQWLMCVNYALSVEKDSASGNVHGVIWFLSVEDSGIWLKSSLLVSHGPAAAAIIKRNKQATKQLSRKQFWTSVLINVLNLITTDQTIMSVAFVRTETPISDSLVVLQWGKKWTWGKKCTHQASKWLSLSLNCIWVLRLNK